VHSDVRALRCQPLQARNRLELLSGCWRTGGSPLTLYGRTKQCRPTDRRTLAVFAVVRQRRSRSCREPRNKLLLIFDRRVNAPCLFVSLMLGLSSNTSVMSQDPTLKLFDDASTAGRDQHSSNMAVSVGTCYGRRKRI